MYIFTSYRLFLKNQGYKSK